MKKMIVSLCAMVLCAGSVSAQYHYQDSTNPEILRHAAYHAPCRTVHDFPVVNGFNVYAADFHTHSIYSDGKVMPAFRVEEAWLDGLDIMAVTEHIEVRSCERTFVDYLSKYSDRKYRKAKNTSLLDAAPDKDGIMVDLNYSVNQALSEAEKYGILIVPGTEITRRQGHFNALFTTDNNLVYDPDPIVSMRNAKSQGALIMHNHPGWHRKNLDYSPLEKQAYEEGLIDGVEVMNMTEFYPAVIDRVRQNGQFIAADTDIHGSTASDYRLGGFDRPMTLVLAKEKSLEAVREALKSGRTLAYGFGVLCGEEHLLKDFFLAGIKAEVLMETSKEKVVMLANSTSVPYILQRKGQNPVHLDPHSAIRMSVGAKNSSLKFSILNMWSGAASHPEVVLPLCKDEYDVFLLIGQSNMGGRGEMLPEDEEIIEGVYLLNDRNQVEPAKGRLNRYAFDIEMKKCGFCLGTSFSRTLAERTGRKILLVVNAHGATDIEQWDGIPGNQEVTGDGKMVKDGSPANPNQLFRAEDFFDRTIERTKAAIASGGTLKAILWHQGCNDAAEANTTYMNVLQTVVRNLRRELGNVPFIAGEIEQWRGFPTSIDFNKMIGTIGEHIENSDYVSSDGLKNLASEAGKYNGKGGPHFDRESLIVLGERYAEKVLEMVYGITQ